MKDDKKQSVCNLEQTAFLVVKSYEVYARFPLTTSYALYNLVK